MGKTVFHKSKNLDFFKVDSSTEMEIPLAPSTISAGFPSPAEDFIDKSIDLNKHYIRNKEATYFVRVKGNSMIDAGINDGDLLIIDKSLNPQNNNIAVCYLDGEFTVKRIKVEKDCIYLNAENEQYKPIKVTKDNEFVIWGIVTTILKSV